mgnify:CR=1 FL=1
MEYPGRCPAAVGYPRPGRGARVGNDPARGYLPKDGADPVAYIAHEFLPSGRFSRGVYIIDPSQFQNSVSFEIGDEF